MGKDRNKKLLFVKYLSIIGLIIGYGMVFISWIGLKFYRSGFFDGNKRQLFQIGVLLGFITTVLSLIILIFVIEKINKMKMFEMILKGQETLDPGKHLKGSRETKEKRYIQPFWLQRLSLSSIIFIPLAIVMIVSSDDIIQAIISFTFLLICIMSFGVGIGVTVKDFREKKKGA